MTNKIKYMSLLVLTVVLMMVVSSRVSPKAAREEPNRPGDWQSDYTSVPSATPEPPEETPEATQNIRDILPGVSIFDWELKLVNNVNVLPNTFYPAETVEIEPDGRMVMMDSRAVEPMRNMIKAARDAGYEVHVADAYRSYSTQAYNFFGKASQIAWGGTVSYEEAEMQARSIVAYPGTSEHQTGLCADIIDRSDTVMKADELEDLELIQWLREHCAEYGFIARYPKDKKDITGWYEPWHFRYVGVDAAKYIMDNDLCLEEFIQLFY